MPSLSSYQIIAYLYSLDQWEKHLEGFQSTNQQHSPWIYANVII